MTTRHELSKSRTARPVAEELEGRRLLSSVVTGRDIDGDTFVIRLVGPGQLRVVKQAGADGNPAPLDSASSIRDITIAGTDPRSSRVVGTVTRGAGGDGRVFFANLEKFSSPSPGATAWSGSTCPSSSWATPTRRRFRPPARPRPRSPSPTA